MTIDTICDACINAVRVAGYNESTVSNYEGVTRKFKRFCKERNVTEYSCEIGNLMLKMLLVLKLELLVQIVIIPKDDLSGLLILFF